MKSTSAGPVNALCTVLAKAVTPALIALAELKSRRAA